jgi:hypothetical protein
MADHARAGTAPGPAPPEERNAQWAVRELEAALRGLQFGQVTVIVQDGVVVQVERLERRRFQRGARKEGHGVHDRP